MDDAPDSTPASGADASDATRGPQAHGNALSAPAYTAMLAVDARVMPALLDSLEDAGVAAFSRPSAGERGGYLETRVPMTPTHQLYVDATRRRDAELVVAAELPGLLAELSPDESEDAEFARIVAEFDAPSEGTIAPWPVSEDVGAPVVRPADESVTFTRWTRGPDPVAEPEHFVPPPPPPLPKAHPITLWAWVAVVTGALILLFHAATGEAVPTDQLGVAVLTIVGGLGTLIWRMRDTSPVSRCAAT
ncbi:MAG: hypothetical protein LC640_01785 [Frankia sp.]|nr:hypothetical protein [Frankia sp.]